MIFRRLVFHFLMGLFYVPSLFAALEDCINPAVVTIDDGVDMRFCEIPAASGVLIGSDNGESIEQPVRERYFESFQIGQFEVTELQYQTVTGGRKPWVNPFYSDRPAGNRAAAHISRVEAIGFSRIMGMIDRTAIYRLPTEAEWEYSARAGTITDYYWGDDVDPDYVFYDGNEDLEHGYIPREVDTCPNKKMDRKNPGYCANGFGLMHMLGNVSEMTLDVFREDYQYAPENGNEPNTMDESFESDGPLRGYGVWTARDRQDPPLYVVRGGAWFDSARRVRTATRAWREKEKGETLRGFRLVRLPKFGERRRCR